MLQPPHPTETHDERDESLEESETEHTEDPISFPLGDIDETERMVFEKIWKRQDLSRYLLRWKDGYVPPLPTALWDYTWRACDIGCGFGRFILEESARYPERAYLGIDKGTVRGGGMKQRVDDAHRPNLFGLHGNAIPLLAAMPDESFDLITLFYPNPWWPTKHRKKRWAYHPILPKIAKLLKLGGSLVLTSNEGFTLRESRYALLHHPLIAPMLQETYCGPIQESVGRTHFEAKFLQHNVLCGEIRFQKIQRSLF